MKVNLKTDSLIITGVMGILLFFLMSGIGNYSNCIPMVTTNF